MRRAARIDNNQVEVAKRKPLSEAAIERTCSDFLELDGWRTLKTDPVRNREWGKGFGEIGMADRLYIRYGWSPRLIEGDDIGGRLAEVMWIEWKSLRGKLKQNQAAWHMAERARGALTLIAGIDFPADPDGFMEFYRKSGLLRRQGL